MLTFIQDPSSGKKSYLLGNSPRFRCISSTHCLGFQFVSQGEDGRRRADVHPSGYGLGYLLTSLVHLSGMLLAFRFLTGFFVSFPSSHTSETLADLLPRGVPFSPRVVLLWVTYGRLRNVRMR